MRILFSGDVVGEPGRKILRRALPLLREKYQLDLVIANAENSAGGSGLTAKCFKQLVEAGVDAMTMGDHIYRKREIIKLLEAGQPICKPANYPAEAPGPDHLIVQARDDTPVAIISLLGRVFMKPVDCPFQAVDRVLEQLPSDVRVIFVDVHAEATSDKQLLLRYLQGRVSAVVGTHTHVPTADAAVYPPGTAYITDVGMTGPYDGVLGRRYDRVIKTTKTFEPTPFDVAKNDPRISSVLIDVDAETGVARWIELLHLDAAAIEALDCPVPAEI